MVPVTRWTFGQPVTVDFSVAMVWSTATTLPGENTVQVPPGAIPLSLPSGYTYNQATGILRADATLTGCTLNTPTRAASARFRLAGVSTFTLQYLGSRVLSNECRRFGNWEFGALDVSLGGTFLRTVCRDCTGAVTSTTDTLLDGETPYTPTGLVGVCSTSAEDEPCRDSSQTLLCDTAAQEAVTVLDPGNRPGADGWEIVSYTGYGPGFGPEAPLPYPVPHPGINYMGVRSDLSIGPGPAYASYETAPVRWVMRKTFTAPEDGIAVVTSANFRGDGGARVRVNGIDAGMYGQWNQPATSGTAQIPVTAGPNVVEVEVRDGGGTNYIMGRVDIVMTATVQFMRRTVVDCETGETVSVVDTTLDGEPYTVTGLVGQCEPVAECCEQPPPETRLDVETGELCLVDDDSGDAIGRVLVERVYDDQTGLRVEQRYVDPVTGDTVEVPDGASVALCPEEPCRDTYTTQVCDLPVGDPAGTPTATDTSVTPYPWDGDPIRCVNQHPGGGQTLWDGGTVTVPARASGAGGCTPNQWLAGLAASLQAPRPSCDSGTVTITVAVAARNNGPSATAANYAGGLRIHRADTGARLADSGSALGTMPAGTVRTMSATAVSVPAALLAAGQIVVALDVEVWDQTGNTGSAWLLSNFVAAYEFQQAGCETQFLRKIVSDCETGETISVTDTTLNGDPYTVVGEVGECTTLGSGDDAACCDDTETVTLCDVAEDGEVTAFLRHLTYPKGAGTPTIRDTLLDGTEYVPVGEVGVCAGSPAGRDIELTPMCVVNNSDGSLVQRVLAEITYDTATGARLEVNYVDPATWGPVPVPGGAHIDVCPDPDPAEPCGDTEIAQLCDLTYDPQAPIATPAADFALTGNVVVGNAGTTLWFAQANQEANGVAELTVSGLLPAVMYQFRFASAWIGTGAPNPVANAAIYELEILDGATVLASRTRNVSNGSAVFPGGTLTEDLPPVAFIAPATGAVTIRFTDQTTGGGTNNRDLFLMPLEVRTAVLTLNSTPFLRRFTFDCDGVLTSSQDLALDGATPYVVEGEVGSCTADGDTTAAVSPCDVQNVLQACRCDDTDGDGFADTDYVELLAVDCDGALTSMGTYLPDLSAPYAPVAPVDCNQTDEGAPPAVGVQARRLELAAGASWSAADHPTLQSVTAVAHAGTGTVTTADGTSTLHTSEAATWSVGRADDALLSGPLTIAADTGTVTITFTTGVTL